MEPKKPEITIAPQEAIKFNYMLIELFIIKVLGIESFMITDESHISDMRSNISSQGKQISDTEWEFTHITYKRGNKPFWELTDEERKKLERVITHKVSKEDVSFDEDIIKDTYEIFGVQLEPKDLVGPFTTLGLKLSQGLTPEKRKELEQMHRELE